MSKRVVVLALGGNGIQPSNSKGSYEDQFKNIDITAKQIAGLIEDDRSSGIVQYSKGGDLLTLAVKISRGADAGVIAAVIEALRATR